MPSVDSGEASSQLGLVQIGPIEVDPAELQGPGSSLWDLIGDRQLEMRSPDKVLDLPRHGWRQVFPTWDFVALPRDVFAAPHPERRDAWMLVSLHWNGTVWRVGTDPGPIQLHRCRAARRAGLEMRWPAEQTAKAGTLPGVSVDLLNTADHTWVNEAGDHMTVHGWMLGPDGEPITPSMRLFAHAPRLPDLQPGESMSLRVNLETPEIEGLPPGRYSVVAELFDLALRSPTGSLVLTKRPTDPDVR